MRLLPLLAALLVVTPVAPVSAADMIIPRKTPKALPQCPEEIVNGAKDVLKNYESELLALQRREDRLRAEELRAKQEKYTRQLPAEQQRSQPLTELESMSRQILAGSSRWMTSLPISANKNDPVVKRRRALMRRMAEALEKEAVRRWKCQFWPLVSTCPTTPWKQGKSKQIALYGSTTDSGKDAIAGYTPLICTRPCAPCLPVGTLPAVATLSP